MFDDLLKLYKKKRLTAKNKEQCKDNVPLSKKIHDNYRSMAGASLHPCAFRFCFILFMISGIAIAVAAFKGWIFLNCIGNTIIIALYFISGIGFFVLVPSHTEVLLFRNSGAPLKVFPALRKKYEQENIKPLEETLNDFKIPYKKQTLEWIKNEIAKRKLKNQKDLNIRKCVEWVFTTFIVPLLLILQSKILDSTVTKSSNIARYLEILLLLLIIAFIVNLVVYVIQWLFRAINHEDDSMEALEEAVEYGFYGIDFWPMQELNVDDLKSTSEKCPAVTSSIVAEMPELTASPTLYAQTQLEHDIETSTTAEKT